MSKGEAWRLLREAMQDPTRIGDAAVYKSELLGSRAAPAVELALAKMDAPFPEVDVPALRELPRGALGREYVEFLSANGLNPFRLSDAVGEDVLARNIFVARYGLLHDLFHVLTGFDTRWAGELGVWSFVAAQGYARTHWVAVVLACMVYPLIAPLQIPRLWRNLWLGVRMGRAAKSLITTRLEESWLAPVAKLRRDLGIEAADELDAVVVG